MLNNCWLMSGLQVLRTVRYESEVQIINRSGDILFEGLHPRFPVDVSYTKDILEAEVFTIQAVGSKLVIEVRVKGTN